MAMSPVRKPRSVLLRERLRVVNAELEEARESEHAEVLRTARDNEREYLAAKKKREDYIRTVMNRPKDERPTSEEMAEAIGVSRQLVDQIKNKK